MAIERIKSTRNKVIDVRQLNSLKLDKVNSVHHVLDNGIHLVWNRDGDNLGGVRVQGLGVLIQGLYIKLNGQ